MGESCSLICRRKNRLTGELSNKLSLLHLDLLNIGKSNKFFNRLKANKAFYLSQSDKFLRLYNSELILDSEDIDAEPILASFYEVAKSIMPEVKLKDIRDILAKKFSEGVYSFEEARDKMISFNKEMQGAHTFMGTIRRQDNGKYRFEVTYNAIEEQEALMQTLADKNFIDIITRKLNALGIGIELSSSSLYSTESYNRLAQGLLGLIKLKDGEKVTSELAKETGHAIVGTLGIDNPLIKRLMAIAEKHPEAIGNLLNEDDWVLIQNMPKLKLIRELVGHIIGKYLEDKKNIENINLKANIKSLIERVLDYIKTKFSFTDREYKLALYDAKYLAYKAAKDFLGDNFKGTLNNALNTLETLKATSNELLLKLQLITQLLGHLAEYSKDWGFNTRKAFNEVFEETLTRYTELNRQSRENNEIGLNIGTIKDLEIQDASVTEIIKALKFIINNVLEAQVQLVVASSGKHPLTGNVILDNEICHIIRKNEVLYQELVRLSERIQDIIYSFSSESSNSEFLRQQLHSLQETIRTALSGIDIENPSHTDVVTKGYLNLINEARRKLATRLLTKINGNDFIFLELHVTLKSIKSIRQVTRHKDNLLNLREEMLSTEINPPLLWFSRYISAMGDSPSIINQLIQAAVEEKKHDANVKGLNAKDKLYDLYLKLRTYGISDTRVFMETDDSGDITGNIISERNWGLWEKNRREAYLQWKDTWWEANKHLFSTFSEASKDLMFIEAKGKFLENWHAKNSVQIPCLDSSGNEKTDEEGNQLLYWAPAISTDEKISNKTRLYDGKLYNKLLNSSELKDRNAVEWLKEYMQFKRELDALLPNGATNAFGVRAPQFEGTFANKLHGAYGSNFTGEHIKRVGKVPFSHFIMQKLGENPSDTEYGGEHDTYNEEDLKYDDEIIFSHAYSDKLNSINRIPIYGVRKLLNPLNVSTDLIHSTLAYAAMAYNYSCLNEIIDLVEVLHHQLEEQEVGKGGFTIKDLSSGEYLNHSAIPGYYRRLEDYMHQLVYNDYAPKNNKKAYKFLKKGLGVLTGYGSLYFLLFNLTSAATNALTGFWEMLKEAIGSEDFGIKEFGLALGIYLGYWTIGAVNSFYNGTFGLKNNKGSDNESHDKLTLFLKHFDAQNENQREFRDYHILTLGYQTFNRYSYTNIVMAPYTITDRWMQAIAYIATAKATKLRNKNGEEKSIWDAYEVKDDKLTLETIKDSTGNEEDAEWKIIDKNQENILETLKEKIDTDAVDTVYLKSVYKYDDDGNIVIEDGKKVLRDIYIPWDAKTESVFKAKCRSINDRMHGVYNIEDGGAFLGMLLGPAFASLKKYAIGLIDRRFATTRYDFRSRRLRLGSVITIADLAADYLFAKDRRVLEESGRLKYGIMATNIIIGAIQFACIIGTGGIWAERVLKDRGYSQHQIANIRRFWADNAIPELLKILLWIVAPPDEQEKSQGSWTIKLLNSLGLFNRENKEFEEAPWFKSLSEALLTTYVEGLKFSRHIPGVPDELTINDEEFLTKDWIRKQAADYDKTIPFSIKGILYYQLYRSLIEQEAYRIGLPGDLYGTFGGLFGEYKNLTSSSIVSFSALADTGILLDQLYSHKSYEDLKELYERKGKKAVEGYTADGLKIYVRGINKNFKKGALHLIKIGPYRSLNKLAFGNTSKKNEVWWRYRSLGLEEPNDE